MHEINSILGSKSLLRDEEMVVYIAWYVDGSGNSSADHL
jgi:hypothetical protein